MQRALGGATSCRGGPPEWIMHPQKSALLNTIIGFVGLANPSASNVRVANKPGTRGLLTPDRMPSGAAVCYKMRFL